MEQAPPPLLESIPPAPRTPRRRWGIHLALLTAYPLILGGLAFFMSRGESQPVLPTNPLTLLLTMSLELLTFGVIFGVAWLASRASAEELMLRWKGGWRPVWHGFLYSIGLRVVLALLVILIGLLAAGLGFSDKEMAKKMQPQTEQLVSAQALVDDPLYLFLNMTFVSFVVAGMREELWRAGMLAGLFAVFPRLWECRRGRLGAVCLTAIVFGLGHLVQGWGGVMMTAVLGLGLGLIIVVHRSIWAAVLAHGFFDATTFALLYFLARFRPEWISGVS